MLRDYINIIRFNFNSLLFLFFSFFPFLVTRTIRIARSLYNNLDSGCKQLGDKRNKYRVIPPSPSMHSYTHLRASSKNLRTKERRKKKEKTYGSPLLHISPLHVSPRRSLTPSLLQPYPLPAETIKHRYATRTIAWASADGY